MSPYYLNNFETQKYYQNKPRLSVYWRVNLPKRKIGKYVVNVADYKPIGTQWIALYVKDNKHTLIDLESKTF